MRALHRSGICALALIAGSAALQLEPAIVRDLVFDHGTGRIAIGAVRAPLWSTAFAQAADSFSLENVSFSFGGAAYDVKRIDLSGVTSSRAEIESLFTSGSSEPLMHRLAKINAKQVTIPEARVKQQIGTETQTVVYKNITLADIVNGRIASLTVDTTGMETTGPDGSILLSTGRATVSDLDMGALASLYETKADGPSTPLTRIYGAFSIDGMDVTESTEGVNFKIGRVSGRDFLARPTKDSWAGTTALLTELSGKDNLAEEETRRLAAIVADLLGAFDIGMVEATGIEIKTPTQKADGSNSASSPSGSIRRIAYTGATGSQPADMRMEGLNIGNQENRVKIDTVSLTGFSIAPTLNGLSALQGKSLEELDQSTLRSLIPTLGTLRLSGIDIDITSEGKNGSTPERTQLTVNDYEITADKPVNGIPTNIRIEQRNAAMTLPANSSDEFIKELLALGYKTFDTSFVVAATWNETASEIDLKEVSMQAQDMGSLSLTGLLGNVSKDLFSADEATAAAALMGVKARSADVVFEDRGLFSRYLAKAAKEQKISPEALRESFVSATPLVMSSIIGNSEQAKTLSQAVARFIAQPGKLTINAQPKNPSGFGIFDVMMASEPKDAIEELNITAKAE